MYKDNFQTEVLVFFFLHLRTEVGAEMQIFFISRRSRRGNADFLHLRAECAPMCFGSKMQKSAFWSHFCSKMQISAIWSHFGSKMQKSAFWSKSGSKMKILFILVIKFCNLSMYVNLTQVFVYVSCGKPRGEKVVKISNICLFLK